MFEYVHFICGNVAIPKADEGSIQKHKRLCPRCIEKAELKSRENELKYEGRQRVRYCLHFILQSSLDISRLQAKLSDPNISEAEKKYRIQRELDEAESIKKREERELQKLLEHEENEIIRNDALEEFERCQKMTDKERRKEYHAF